LMWKNDAGTGYKIQDGSPLSCISTFDLR